MSEIRTSPEPMRRKDRRAERGSVLFYILIAVALLAALSYAVAGSMRGSSGSLDAQRVGIAATEILDYADTLSKAVAQLRLRGCKDTEISFANTASTAVYTNGSAPGDNSCDVFNVAGGGVTFRDAPDGASNLAESIFFDGNMEVQDIGLTNGAASSSDLLVLFRDLKQEICEKLNKTLGMTSLSPTDSGLNYTAFQGTYAHNAVIADEAGGASLAGQKAGCVQDTNDSTYNFYRVLIAR